MTKGIWAQPRIPTSSGTRESSSYSSSDKRREAAATFLLEMFNRGSSWDRQHNGRLPQDPSQSYL
jgi:hypothetical protein